MFLTFTTIEDYEIASAFLLENFNDKTSGDVIANAMISKFKELMSSLYKKGIKKCLSDRAHGDLETFYAHVLGWCFPEIVEITYEKHRLGSGVFAMKVFEATNVNTKKLVRNKSNHKCNMCLQTMVQPVTSYANYEHNVRFCLEVRAKGKKKLIEAIKRMHHDNISFDHSKQQSNLV